MSCDYAACAREAVERLNDYQFCRGHAYLHHTDDVEAYPATVEHGRFGPMGGQLQPCGSLMPLLRVLRRNELQRSDVA